MSAEVFAVADRTRLTKKKKEEFLEHLRTTANVSDSALKINVSRTALYERRDKDPAFKADWDKAVELGTDALEDEGVRRAKDGVTKPVFYKGMICGGVQEYSDTLLMFMLKGRRPEKFKDRNEVTGKDGEPLTVQIVRHGDSAASE